MICTKMYQVYRNEKEKYQYSKITIFEYLVIIINYMLRGNNLYLVIHWYENLN